jgi:hypothetical protein
MSTDFQKLVNVSENLLKSYFFIFFALVTFPLSLSSSSANNHIVALTATCGETYKQIPVLCPKG